MPPLSSFDKSGSISLTTDFNLRVAKDALHFPSRKTVLFSPDPVVIDILHIKDFSLEEKRATWYTRNELRTIKDEAKQIANLDRSENSEVCFRGLEAKTLAGARLKRQNRIDARAAVFFEQEMQEGEGYSDPDAIADVYFEYTERCELEAQMMALRDAADITNEKGIQFSALPSFKATLLDTSANLSAAA